jgi:hypothetical protein
MQKESNEVEDKEKTVVDGVKECQKDQVLKVFKERDDLRS